jgi:hypothetical protein
VHFRPEQKKQKIFNYFSATLSLTTDFVFSSWLHVLDFGINKTVYRSRYAVVKVFNGRAATEEYMSTHSLTFSTPEMTLRKFALWLGERLSAPGGSSEQMPRLFLYVEEKGEKDDNELAPAVDDSFKPSGAVTDMYKDVSQSQPTENLSPPPLVPLDRQTLEPESKYCINCGNKLKPSARFCVKCGSEQG